MFYSTCYVRELAISFDPPHDATTALAAGGFLTQFLLSCFPAFLLSCFLTCYS